jgi:hypothetical protein
VQIGEHLPGWPTGQKPIQEHHVGLRRGYLSQQAFCLDRYANNQHAWFLVKAQLQTDAQLLIRIRYEKTHFVASLDSDCPRGESDKETTSPLATVSHKTLSSTSVRQSIFLWDEPHIGLWDEPHIGDYSNHFSPLICRIPVHMHNT